MAARTETECSIEGCTSMVLARGWCGRHYNRWRTKGDPNTFERANEPGAPVVSSRRVGTRLVHFTASGQPFILTRRVRSHENVPARRYGAVFICENCGNETFSPSSGRNVNRFCSKKCSGPASRDIKLGKTKKQKNPIGYLDKLFSIIVRSEGHCVNCGASDMHQCAHGFSRRYRNARWDTRNAFCLCARCHMYFTYRPLEWDEWLRERWGDTLYWELRRLALSTEKVDLDAVREDLVRQIRERDITAARLPKTVVGWAGLKEMADGV